MLYSVFAIKVEQTFHAASKAYAIIHNTFGAGASSLKPLKDFIDNQLNMKTEVQNHFLYEGDKSAKCNSDYKLGDITPNFEVYSESKDSAIMKANDYMNTVYSIIKDEFPKVLRIDNEVELINMETKKFLAFANKEDKLYMDAKEAIIATLAAPVAKKTTAKKTTTKKKATKKKK